MLLAASLGLENSVKQLESDSLEREGELKSGLVLCIKRWMLARLYPTTRCGISPVSGKTGKSKRKSEGSSSSSEKHALKDACLRFGSV